MSNKKHGLKVCLALLTARKLTLNIMKLFEFLFVGLTYSPFPVFSSSVDVEIVVQFEPQDDGIVVGVSIEVHYSIHQVFYRSRKNNLKI